MNTNAFFHTPLYSRNQGRGATVVCLHASTDSHTQWGALADALSGRCQVVMPDLLGHGHSPSWPVGQASTLQVDTDAVGAVVRAANSGWMPGAIHLVGHAYGAAVAMQFALRNPGLVQSLTLYEPVPFGVIRALSPGDAAHGEIEDIAHSVELAIRARDLLGAARIFWGYWGGANAWEAQGEAQRSAIVACMATVPRHFDALFGARWNAQILGRLTMPTLLIQGSNTRLPARRAADLLGSVLPQMTRDQITGAGHLGPMTHDLDVTSRTVAHLASAGALTHCVRQQHSAYA